MTKETQVNLLGMFYAVIESEGKEPRFSREVYSLRDALGLEKSTE